VYATTVGEEIHPHEGVYRDISRTNDDATEVNSDFLKLSSSRLLIAFVEMPREDSLGVAVKLFQQAVMIASCRARSKTIALNDRQLQVNRTEELGQLFNGWGEIAVSIEMQDPAGPRQEGRIVM
jgi:hypothetical protein